MPPFKVAAPSRRVWLFAASCPAPAVICVLNWFNPSISCPAPVWSAAAPLVRDALLAFNCAAPPVSVSLFASSCAKPSNSCLIPAEACVFNVATCFERLPISALKSCILESSKSTPVLSAVTSASGIWSFIVVMLSIFSFIVPTVPNKPFALSTIVWIWVGSAASPFISACSVSVFKGVTSPTEAVTYGTLAVTDETSGIWFAAVSSAVASASSPFCLAAAAWVKRDCFALAIWPFAVAIWSFAVLIWPFAASTWSFAALTWALMLFTTLWRPATYCWIAPNCAFNWSFKPVACSIIVLTGSTICVCIAAGKSLASVISSFPVVSMLSNRVINCLVSSVPKEAFNDAVPCASAFDAATRSSVVSPSPSSAAVSVLNAPWIWVSACAPCESCCSPATYALTPSAKESVPAV